jgi:hypothetical protein
MPMRRRHPSNLQPRPHPHPQVEIHRIAYQAERLGMIVGLAKHAMTTAAAVFSVWLCVQGLQQIVLQNPANISALAKVIEALSPTHVLSGLVALAGGATVLIYRHRNNRSIRKIDALRIRLERDDLYNAGSGLTETGNTPKGQR